MEDERPELTGCHITAQTGSEAVSMAASRYFQRFSGECEKRRNVRIAPRVLV